MDHLMAKKNNTNNKDSRMRQVTSINILKTKCDNGKNLYVTKQFKNFKKFSVENVTRHVAFSKFVFFCDLV